MKYVVFKRSGHKILTILHPETASTFNVEISRLMKKRISRKIIDTNLLPRNYLGPGYNKKIKRYTMEMLGNGSTNGLMKLIRKLEISLNYVYQA
jgi:hypothetical protein